MKLAQYITLRPAGLTRRHSDVHMHPHSATDQHNRKHVNRSNVSDGTPENALVPTDWMALAAASSNPISAIWTVRRSPRRRRAVSSSAPLHARVSSWSAMISKRRLSGRMTEQAADLVWSQSYHGMRRSL